MNRKSIVHDLKHILGADKVVDDELLIKLYAKNAVYLESSAIAVTFPQTTNDVSMLVKYAYKNNLKIYPQGSTSELVGSSTPSEDGIIISFERMNKIKEVSVIDSYAIVEPGVRLIELNNTLVKYKLMFPIDPASVKAASVGGAINTGAGGMMGIKYGTIKDWVLGLKIVLPDENGTILNLGGRTAKCRQGYDLIRLIIGSEGTLALITEAILKIAACPENVISIAGFFPSLKNLVQTVVEVKRSSLDIYMMEFIDAKTVDICIKAMDVPIRGRGHFLLTSVIVCPEGANRILGLLHDIYSSNNALSIYKAKNLSQAEKLGIFDVRRALYPASIRIASQQTGYLSRKLIYMEDISVPPSKLIDAIDMLNNLSNKYQIPMTLGGHIGDGNLHPIFWVDEKDEAGKRMLLDLVKDIMEIAIKLGGTISSEHGIGITRKRGLREELKARGSLKALYIMAEIKRIFDPKGILNPNKIF